MFIVLCRKTFKKKYTDYYYKIIAKVDQYLSINIVKHSI